jgi:hypothetical protein
MLPVCACRFFWVLLMLCFECGETRLLCSSLSSTPITFYLFPSFDFWMVKLGSALRHIVRFSVTKLATGAKKLVPVVT